MKFTEGLFRMPIKIYDKFAMYKNMKQEELTLDKLDRPLPDDWVRGYVHIPIDEVVGFQDHFSPERKVEEVAEKGFDLTIVYTKSLGRFECTWRRERFEEELNKSAKSYEDGIEKLVESAFAEKELMQPEKKKRSFWSKW